MIKLAEKSFGKACAAAQSKFMEHVAIACRVFYIRFLVRYYIVLFISHICFLIMDTSTLVIWTSLDGALWAPRDGSMRILGILPPWTFSPLLSIFNPSRNFYPLRYISLRHFYPLSPREVSLPAERHAFFVILP